MSGRAGGVRARGGGVDGGVSVGPQTTAACPSQRAAGGAPLSECAVHQQPCGQGDEHGCSACPSHRAVSGERCRTAPRLAPCTDAMRAGHKPRAPFRSPWRRLGSNIPCEMYTAASTASTGCVHATIYHITPAHTMAPPQRAATRPRPTGAAYGSPQFTWQRHARRVAEKAFIQSGQQPFCKTGGGGTADRGCR
jgi:hypothetical protein